MRKSRLSRGQRLTGIVFGHTQNFRPGKIVQTDTGPEQLQPIQRPQLIVQVEGETGTRHVNLPSEMRKFLSGEDPLITPDRVMDAIERARRIADVGDRVEFEVRYPSTRTKTWAVLDFVRVVTPRGAAEEKDEPFHLADVVQEALVELDMEDSKDEEGTPPITEVDTGGA